MKTNIQKFESLVSNKLSCWHEDSKIRIDKINEIKNNSMIKINELRIGNSLQLDGEIYQVNELRNTLQCVELIRPDRNNPKLNEYEECDLDYNGLMPILLTGELLVNLGFEKIGIAYINGEYIAKQQSDNEWTIDIEPVNMVYHTISTLKYVHELQNLFFSITGEELVFSSTEP